MKRVLLWILEWQVCSQNLAAQAEFPQKMPMAANIYRARVAVFVGVKSPVLCNYVMSDLQIFSLSLRTITILSFWSQRLHLQEKMQDDMFIVKKKKKKGKLATNKHLL